MENKTLAGGPGASCQRNAAPTAAGPKRPYDDLLRVLEISGLAFSIAFELVVGPFVGLLIGTYLVDHYNLHGSVLTIAMFTGFVASVYNVSVLIRTMIMIERRGARIPLGGSL